MKVHTSCLQAIDFSLLDFGAVAMLVVSVSAVSCHWGRQTLRPQFELSGGLDLEVNTFELSQKRENLDLRDHIFSRKTILLCHLSR